MPHPHKNRPRKGRRKIGSKKRKAMSNNRKKKQYMDRAIKKGDLVTVMGREDPVIKEFLRIHGVSTIIGVVLQCRYKKDIYLFKPANNPYMQEPYWVEGRYLLPYEG